MWGWEDARGLPVNGEEDSQVMGPSVTSAERGMEGKSIGFGVRLGPDLSDLGKVTPLLLIPSSVGWDGNSCLAVSQGVLVH